MGEAARHFLLKPEQEVVPARFLQRRPPTHCPPPPPLSQARSTQPIWDGTRGRKAAWPCCASTTGDRSVTRVPICALCHIHTFLSVPADFLF